MAGLETSGVNYSWLFYRKWEESRVSPEPKNEGKQAETTIWTEPKTLAVSQEFKRRILWAGFSVWREEAQTYRKHLIFFRELVVELISSDLSFKKGIMKEWFVFLKQIYFELNIYINFDQHEAQ